MYKDSWIFLVLIQITILYKKKFNY